MSLLLQVSDTHFGTEQPAVVEAVLKLAHAQRPDVVVLSGDITQRARRAQFNAARVFVERLGPAPVLAIPGNHDIPLFNLPGRLFAPYANHRHVFGAELEPEFESPEMLVLALNTTRAWRHEDGELSSAQIERVARRLRDAAPAQLRIVVVHQPIAVTRPEDRTNLLHGRAEAIARWSACGADLILGGHIHLPFVVPLHERDASLPRRLWAVQAGTAVSSRLREGVGNSVNLIRGGDERAPRRCVVERWDYRPLVHAFQLAKSHVLEGDPRPARDV